MAKPTGDEIAQHYQAAHERVVDIAKNLDPDQADAPVRATPGWSVHDVLAHLAAVTTDGLAGRIHGIPGDDLTAQQVADRRGRSVAELIDEWSPNVPLMLDGARAGLVPPNLAVDAVTHEQDLRGALGLAKVPDVAAIRFSNSLYAWGAARRVKAAGLAPLRIVTTDTADEYGAGDAEAEVTLQAPAFEVFRALSGRRSRRQAAEYVWSGADIGPYLDVLNVFGDLPPDDVAD